MSILGLIGVKKQGSWISTKAACSDCGRVFDMFNDEEAEEYMFGHDCEV